MSKKVALLTGATGFVGGRLAHHLISEGWVVEAIIRSTSNIASLPSALESERVHIYDGTTDSVVSIMERARPDVVFHLASLVISEHRSRDVEPLIQSNVLFGVQLLEAMSLTGSSCLVNTGTSWQHYGCSTYSPVNLYAATKQAFESLLQYYVEARAIRAVSLKLFDTYGPNDPRPKLLNLLRTATTSKVPLAMTPGRQKIDLVHVSDVARAYCMAAERLLHEESATHEEFAVSSGQPISLRHLVAKLAELWGRTMLIEWGGRAYREREVMEPWSGPTLPGWRPLINLTDGMKELAPRE